MKKIKEATGKEPKPNHGSNTIKSLADKVGANSTENFKLALKALRDDNYEAFINDLNDLAKADDNGKIAKLRDAIVANFNNPKIENAIKVKSAKAVLPILKIRPTQSEVDMEKSLAFPLKKNPQSCSTFFGNKPIQIIKPIVVAKVGDQFFVIDGHHRWSQVYCMNPKAKMNAFIVESPQLFETPDDVLKFVQMQIFIDKKGKEVPKETADSGYNLYTIEEKAFKTWCIENMTDESANIAWNCMFIKPQDEADPSIAKKKRHVTSRLWKNVLIMRKHASPIEGAHKRDDMPQTGYTADQMGNIAGKTAVKLKESNSDSLTKLLKEAESSLKKTQQRLKESLQNL